MQSVLLHDFSGQRLRLRNFLILYFLLTLAGFDVTVAESQPNQQSGTAAHNATECHTEVHDGITLASFRWEEIGVYFTISAFVIIAGFAKLGFHKLSWLSSKVPESCLLVLLGLAVSALVFFTTKDEPEDADPCSTKFKFPQFTSKVFFFILLPPIILDSAYSLHDRVFLDNLGTVLVFAVIGTLFNAFVIGGTLYGVSYGGLIPNMALNLTDAFVFSSLISAVDPVAVLAIFQELGVNKNLYFLIFGESLLNDGVTVVLYNTMQVFRRMSVITVGQCFLAVLSFFTVSFGGIFIGIFFGLLTSLVTKWTNSVRVVEPLAMLGLAYLSYLTAELFHFSGIICLIVCGLIQAHYGFYNISQKSYTCVKYFTKMASVTSDTIIFMFLGMVLVNEDHKWNTAFVLWSLLFCFVYRFIAVFSLSALANIYRTKAIGFEEQFITAYGGLRGAVAFSLASTLDDDMAERNTYIFTTLVVILFTIFIQGITIKPLVNLLKIQKRHYDKKNLVEEISETSMDHMMAGIEEIMGHHGDFYLRGLIMHYNDKYLKKWFLHEASDNKLTRLFEKIALSEHYAHLYGPVAMIEDQTKPLLAFSSKEEIRTGSVSSLIQQEELLFKASESRLSIDQQNELIDLSLTEASELPIYHPVSVDLRKEQRKYSLTSLDRPPHRRRSTRSIFTPIRQIMPMPATPSPPSSQDGENDTAILRRALRDNKYNKLHYTYNRNLVNEEDQELSNHLNRRSLNAQRMTTLASANCNNRQPSDDPQQTLPGQVPPSGDKSVTFQSLANAVVLMERHRRRSVIQKEKVKNMRAITPIEEGTNENSPISVIYEEDTTRESEDNDTEKSPSDNHTEDIPLIEILSHGNSTPKDNVDDQC